MQLSLPAKNPIFADQALDPIEALDGFLRDDLTYELYRELLGRMAPGYIAVELEIQRVLETVCAIPDLGPRSGYFELLEELKFHRFTQQEMGVINTSFLLTPQFEDLVGALYALERTCLTGALVELKMRRLSRAHWTGDLVFFTARGKTAREYWPNFKAFLMSLSWSPEQIRRAQTVAVLATRALNGVLIN